MMVMAMRAVSLLLGHRACGRLSTGLRGSPCEGVRGNRDSKPDGEDGGAHGVGYYVGR